MGDSWCRAASVLDVIPYCGHDDATPLHIVQRSFLLRPHEAAAGQSIELILSNPANVRPMGKSNKSKRAAKKTPAASEHKPQLSTVPRVTEDPGTPLSTTDSPSDSSITSPGEISPPDTPNPNPATDRLEGFEQGITQKLNKSGKGDIEDQEEVSVAETTGDDNLPAAHPHTAPSVVSVEYTAALLTAIEREKEREEREAAAVRAPYTYDRKTPIPTAMAHPCPPPLPHLDTKGPLPPPMEPPSPAQQVRYTFSGHEVSSDENKVAAERARHPWTTDNKEEEGKKEQVLPVEAGVKRDYGEGEEEAPTPETDKPSYAEMAKVGQQQSQPDLGESYEDIGLPPGPSEFLKTPKNSIAGLDAPANKATIPAATIQPKPSDELEARELQSTTLGPGDIGTNIGDVQHQKLVHKEKALHNLPIDLPQHPAVEFTSGPAVPMAKPRSPSIQAPPFKRHSTDLGEGQHPAKIQRRTSVDLGMEPVIEATLGAVSKEDIMLAHQEDRDTTKEYLDLFEGKQEEGEPSSSLLEGALTSEDDAVYRTDTMDLHQQLQVRDTAIVDLQQTVITLTERLEMLEVEKKKSATTTTVDENGIAVESEEQVEKFTTISPAPRREREGDTMVKWGIWTGALIGTATLGGWLGALIERGTVGKQLAEWIWRQARGGYGA
jgi:hypothetical protein